MRCAGNIPWDSQDAVRGSSCAGTGSVGLKRCKHIAIVLPRGQDQHGQFRALVVQVVLARRRRRQRRRCMHSSKCHDENRCQCRGDNTLDGPLAASASSHCCRRQTAAARLTSARAKCLLKRKRGIAHPSLRREGRSKKRLNDMMMRPKRKTPHQLSVLPMPKEIQDSKCILLSREHRRSSTTGT